MATNNQQPSFILTVTCQAMVGVVAAITGFLAERQGYIAEMAQYDDEATGRFFCRVVFRLDPEVSPDIETLKKDFVAIADKFDMGWSVRDAGVPTRTLILVSKADHCLDDLLFRKRKGELFMEVVAVVSNHQDLRAMVEREGIRFVHLPVTPKTRAQQETRLLEIVDETAAELVVLARYMQILSEPTTTALAGRCINIHHSFLPGFKGARPYHQAWERGVKLIGA
ncbi:MAG: formyltetrahydrofolate deformylase, partial [Gammaproteobacteria bacterium]